jgi:hypothetical protein
VPRLPARGARGPAFDAVAGIDAIDEAVRASEAVLLVEHEDALVEQHDDVDGAGTLDAARGVEELRGGGREGGRVPELGGAGGGEGGEGDEASGESAEEEFHALRILRFHRRIARGAKVKSRLGHGAV